MKVNLKTLLIAGSLAAVSSASALEVGSLRTQYLENPLGIDADSPAFSWQLKADKRATTQASYQVELATDPMMGNIVFDSGTVSGRESANVRFDNMNLQPSTRYYWRVTVTDNYGNTATSSDGSYFETGLRDSGWSGAKWIGTSGTSNTQTTPAEATPNYTIDFDFEIDRASMGFVWGATDHNNFYMWQVNLEQDTPRLRPHVWTNGNPACMAEIPITGVSINKWKKYHMTIEVADEGKTAKTYIDNVLVDTRTGDFPYGQVGMRADWLSGPGRSHKPENAFYKNLKVTANNGDVLFEDNFADNSGFGAGEIVKGQLYITGNPQNDLTLQKNFNANPDVKNYTVEGECTIEQFCAGIVFGATDESHFYMWQINLEQGFPRLRPHRWNGSPALHGDEINLSNKVDLKEYHPFNFKIVVSNDGTLATTYINGVEVDSRQGDYAYGKVGFRHSESEGEYWYFEHAYIDNIEIRNSDNKILYSEDFEDVDARTIPGGDVVDGMFTGNTNYAPAEGNTNYFWANMTGEEVQKLRYDIDTDITLLNDNAALIFSYTKPNSYFMWAINAKDADVPMIRRHVYANSTNPQYSDTRIQGISKDEILGSEHHMKIEVDGSTVRTYLDGNLVDTFKDNTGLLGHGLIGFRVHYDNLVNEKAYWDNVKITAYDGKGNSHVSFSEDFEGDMPDFSAGEVVEVDGNHKLYTYSRNNETKVMQNAAVGSPRFRKEFMVDGAVKSAKLYTSGLGVYTAYVNGRRIGHEQPDGTMVYDELMPGWSDYRSSVFYMTHDVTSLVKEGANTLGAVVSNGWWNGQVSHGIYGSSDVAFLGKLVVTLESGEEITVVTDESWLTSRGGALQGAEIYDGETYDARLNDNWGEAGYDTGLWTAAGIDTQRHGEVMAHEGATVRVMPEHERKPKTITVYEGIKPNGTTYGEINNPTEYGNQAVTLRKGQTMVVDFGQNASGWAKFKVKGQPGTTLKLRYAEMLNDSGEAERGNDDAKGTLYTVALRSAKAAGQYTLCGDESGEEYRPTSTFYGFRYADLTASNDVEIEWITAETISSVRDENSSVRVNDADVNQLYSNILWGQRSNFVSVPTDCPQRDERLGWAADTQVFSMAAMYNSQVQGFYHKWMRDMRDGQLADGRYPNVAPFNWVEHGSAAWADAGIILPWNVYVMYGDKSIIEENYESMERYFDWLATQKEGGYNHVGSDTRYGDWLAFEDTDKRFVSVAYYGYMADIMSKMSKALSLAEGDEYDLKAAKYAKLFEDIKAEFKKRYWSEGRMKGLTQKSQCAYVLALRYGLLHDDDAVDYTIEKLREKIEGNNNTLSTGFLGTAVLNQTLSQFGLDDLAYAILLQHDCPSWLYSVDQGATTIWERWNSYTLEGGISKSIEMNSFNHYAYGAVAEWMYRYMAGIAPDYDNPGFSHILLTPSFDPKNRINDVATTFGSNYGDIKVDWQTTGEGIYTYNVTVPANTEATLVLPVAEGKALLESGKPVEEAEGISEIENNDGKMTMTLGSGSYSFNGGMTEGGVEAPAVGKLEIYPNPVHDTVNVKSDGDIARIQLFSISGVLMAESCDSNSLNMSGYPSGHYIVVATDSLGNVKVGKIIKD